MAKFLIFLSLVFGVVTAISFSSSESCEDENGGGGGGGRPGGRPPGNGNGNGNGNGGGNGGGRPNGGCDAGWRRFNRPAGGWCIKSFAGRLTQASAEAQCKSFGATLSGLQNLEETRYATSAALPIIGRASGSLWIGARRLPRCRLERLTASCTALNTFVWTDQSATGTAGFTWSQAQPDNAYDRKQDCVIVLAASGPITVKDVVWPNNLLDDVGCDPNVTDPSPRAIVGYVCGKKARS